MKVVPILLVFVVFISSGNIVYGQSDVKTESENQLWSGVNLKYKLNKKWRFNYEQQLRFEIDETELEKSISKLGVKYRINKFWDAKVTYRYSWIDQDRNRKRITVDSKFGWEVPKSPFELSYRFQFQYASVNYTDQFYAFIRNEFSTEIDIYKDWSSHLSYEHFNNISELAGSNIHRYGISLDYEINKKLELETFYKFDHKKGKNKNKNQHIFGLKLGFDLDFGF